MSLTQNYGDPADYATMWRGEEDEGYKGGYLKDLINEQDCTIHTQTMPPWEFHPKN